MLDYEIHGGKGGEKKPHTPVETPNNLLSVAYAKVLIAVAEGELAGQPTDQDIFLDGTPLANPDGSKNFGGVKWEWRPGTTDQTYIAGLPEVSTEYNVGVELKYGTPYVRNLTKTELDGMRITFQWPALLEQQSNGDTTGVSMDYSIEISTDSGPFVEYRRYNINGKTNTAYERTHRVDLPKADTGWIVRAVKLTPDSTSGAIQDTMNVKSVAEVVDVKQRYPNTALLYVEFDSRMFGSGSIPKVSVKTKGRVIRVPDNYDPVTRTYSGVWSGAFKWAWSDNPAWVFHDIITQDRFGLGNKVNLNMVDKWSLYEISQYCDVMVDDGHGAGVLEPRHTMNVYIQEKQDAWQVLRDIATSFNGMTYWNGNQFTAIADKQEPFNNAPVFSRSNVINGQFDYTAADDKSIYTSALVSYDEPDNHYNTEVESTFETSQILRWGGDRQVEISAIGCTSRGEAQRRGKYTLITNMYNRTVSFRTGLQGLNDEVMPGKLIHVVDPLIGGRPFTGRIKIAVGRVLTLDRPVDAVAGDIMYITKSNGTSEGRTVEAVAGNIVTLQVAYTELPLPNAVWYLEAADLKSQLFRVTKITSPEESVYEIEAVEYNDSKYGAIDNGARLEPRPISVVPPNIQQPPTNVNVTSYNYVEQTMSVSTMVIAWDQTPNATGYEVQWKVGNGDWVNAGVTGALEINIKGIYTGQYQARVRAINPFGIKSIWASSAITDLNGKVGAPPSLTSLTVTPIVFGMQLNWTFGPGSEDTDRTEIMYSPIASFSGATKLGDFSYPQASHEMNGLKAGQQFFFWGRIVDKTGNIGPYYPLETLNGVMGASSTDLAEYEEYFRDQITDSALGQHLADRIDLIDGPPELPGSVNDRLKELDDQVTAVTDELQDQINNIADLADSMPYDSTKTYTVGQAVLGEDGILYQAKQAVPINTAPPNTAYWTDIGQAVITADGLAARVTLVETTVEEQGDTITAQASTIEGLQTQINGKASSAAVDSLTTRVTSAEGTITAQGSAITGLQTQVNGKADTSALNALTTRVETTEDTIEAQGNALTSVEATLGGIGGLGSNLLPSEYTVFNATSPVTSTDAANYTVTTVADSNTFGGYALQITTNSTAQGAAVFMSPVGTSSLGYVHANMGFKKTKYIVSYRAKASVNGHAISTSLEVISSNNTGVVGNIANQQKSLTTSWVKYSAVIDMDNAVYVGDKMVLFINTNMSQVSGRQVWIDQLMLEEQAGDGIIPSAFVVGNADGKSTANASAITSLTARVTTAEGNITSMASSITSLTASVSGKADTSALETLEATVTQQGDTITAQGTAVTQLQSTVGGMGGVGTNLLLDTYSWLGSTTLPQTVITSPSTLIGISEPLAASKFAYRTTFGSNDANQVVALAPTLDTAGYNIDLTPGKYLVSFYAKGSAANTIQVSLFDGVHRFGTPTAITTTRTRYTFVVTSSTSTRAALAIYPNLNGLGSGTQVTFDSVMVEKQLGDSIVPSPFVSGSSSSGLSAQATAISSLNTRVTNNEGEISAQATKLDGVYVQVNPDQAGDTTGYAGSSETLVGVWSEQSARIEDGVAIGQRIDTVQVQVNDNSASVQEVSTAQIAADGKAAASWSVKLQINSQGQYVTAGIGLGLENTPGGLQSTFLVNADTFAVVNGIDTTLTTPFVVSGGQVFIKDAVIANGSITNAKIGQVIQSDNYVFNTSGWAINKTGGFEMNGAGTGSSRMQLTTNALKFYHTNGVLGIDLSL